MPLFGNKSKKTTAKDILAMIAELPEDERAGLMALLASDAEGEAEEGGDLPIEEGEPEAAPDESSQADPRLEGEESPAEESAESDEINTDVPDIPPEAEEDVEGAIEAVEEAEESEDASEAAEEAENEQVSLSDVLARLAGVEESVKALAQRLEADEAEGEVETDDEDPFGYAFGPENKTASEEDEVEKAKREAGFNF